MAATSTIGLNIYNMITTDQHRTSATSLVFDFEVCPFNLYMLRGAGLQNSSCLVPYFRRMGVVLLGARAGATPVPPQPRRSSSTL